MRWEAIPGMTTQTSEWVSVTRIRAGRRMQRPHLQGPSSKGCGLTRTFRPCIWIGLMPMHLLNGRTGGSPLRWSGKRQGEGLMADAILGAMDPRLVRRICMAELNNRPVGPKWDNTRGTVALTVFVILPAMSPSGRPVMMAAGRRWSEEAIS